MKEGMRTTFQRRKEQVVEGFKKLTGRVGLRRSRREKETTDRQLSVVVDKFEGPSVLFPGAQEESQSKEPMIDVLTLHPFTAQEGLALQREHGMQPEFIFIPSDAEPSAPLGKDVAVKPDLTTPEGLAGFMAASASEDDWNQRTEQVKKTFGGQYPSFWFQSIIMSGLLNEVMNRW